MSRSQWWMTIGAVFAGLSVVAGSFGAHGLDRFFAKKYASESPRTISGFEVPTSWKRLQDFKTGARYQMYHALGLIAVGLLAQSRRKKSLQVAGWCFSFGIILFCGSLYALALTGITKFGAVAPIGGVLLIIGWFAVAIAVCPCTKPDVPTTPDA